MHGNSTGTLLTKIQWHLSKATAVVLLRLCICSNSYARLRYVLNYINLMDNENMGPIEKFIGCINCDIGI